MNLLLGLSRALAAQGAHVAFAVPAQLARHLPKPVNVFLCSATLEMLRTRSEQEIAGFKDLPPDRQAIEMFSRIWPLSVLDHLSRVQDERFDILIHEEGDHAAALLAAATGLPRVCVEWPCPPRSPQLVEQIDSRQRALASSLGLRSLTSANLALTTAPPAFREPGRFAASASRRADFRLVSPDPPEGPVPGLDTLPFARTVHATLGTIPGAYQAFDLVHSIAESLKDRQYNLVLTTGDQTEQFGLAARDSLLVAPHIPHRNLMPHCAAVICHGGVSTVIEALARGIPLVIVPIGGGSQLRMARGCVGAGAGEALQPEYVDRLGDVTDALLAVPGYARRAARLALEIAAMPGPEETARDILRRFSK